jgi:hypothetical protein
MNTIGNLMIALHHESTLAEKRINITLGETVISLGEARRYCRQMTLFCNRNPV